MARHDATGHGNPDAVRCLNCGADLHGGFCGACGQRSIPADPTVSELVGDAWQELSGYDGRIADTFRTLLRPGQLTLEYLNGRRARYLSPMRLYLTVSVIYFVIAAAVPSDAGGSPAELRGPGSLRIGLWADSPASALGEKERAELKAEIDEAPWPLKLLFQAIEKDPAAFRARLFTVMPRVFFGMLPVFAAIVALFYRGRHFPTTLVFAAHLHAFAFLIFAISEAAKFTRSEVVRVAIGLPVAIAFVIYAVRSFRAVFGGSWSTTIGKGAAIGFVYLLTALPAFFIILVWASLT